MRIDWKWVACVGIVFGATALAVAQEPLGDVARKERTRQKPQAVKVVTNEDLPAVEEPATPKSAGEETDADQGHNPADNKNAKGKDEPLTVDEKIKQNQEWKAKIAAQEGKVKALDQEVTQLERDYKLRMSAYYADLGLKLRDQAKWDEDEKKYKEQIATKQKARDAERTKLEDMKEGARKAGVESVD
ncbi:MAG: hypothetical protein ACM3JB_24510 [Acidobacteriaceae bacterium]